MNRSEKWDKQEKNYDELDKLLAKSKINTMLEEENGYVKLQNFTLLHDPNKVPNSNATFTHFDLLLE